MTVLVVVVACKSNAKARSVHGPSLKSDSVESKAGPTDTDPRLGLLRGSEQLKERRLWLAAKFHCLRF